MTDILIIMGGGVRISYGAVRVIDNTNEGVVLDDVETTEGDPTI